MPSRSSASAFDRLAPDQRAAVELVLREGRSYGELADLLGMPEETIRARARNGVAALAPDRLPPTRAGEIADWLLGQQAPAHAARTRALLLSDPSAQQWATMVAEPLRGVTGGESVPALPTAADDDPPRVNGTGPHVGPDEPARSAPADAGDAGSGGGSSRLGGALIIGAAVIVVAAVLVFVFTRGDDDPNPGAGAPVATATASATPAASANDIVLKGPAGSKAVGLMRLFQANDGTVRFAIAAQGVAPNRTGETYSLWFTTSDGAKAQLLGDVKDPVGEKGELTSAGPSNADVGKFPQWFADYDSVLVTLDGKGAKEPGKVILSGDLPHAG